MRYLQSFLLILLSIFSFFNFFKLETASSSFSVYENQIFEDSSETKVKKLQEVFKGLGLYSGEIDGSFDSIEDELLAYQLDTGLISSYSDYGAGYFGNKTIEALEEDYPDTFPALKEEYLKIDEPSTDERYFYVTAYYSPLPGQSRYTTGSYSGDIRLNGEGKITASGEDVFVGLLAGPRNYEYGTKIYLEGIGIGSVEDRGGAIVNAGERGHEYDRIDIWMGYGDEGLERALKWGKRTIKGQVLIGEWDVNIEFDESPVEDYTELRVDAENPEEDNIKQLQELLVELDLYNGDINGEFDTVKNILIDFQLESGVIDSRYDEAAGYFGTKTIAAIREDYGAGFFVEKYVEPGDNIALSNIKKEKVKALKEKLDEYLEKKYSGNSFKISKIKNSLKESLDTLIAQTTSITKKNELKYLQAIL